MHGLAMLALEADLGELGVAGDLIRDATAAAQRMLDRLLVSLLHP